MIGASMAVRAPRTRGLGQMAMDAIRRNGGTLLLPGLPRNWLDSAGTIAATVDNPVGLVQDSVGSSHASQPTTASKPLLRRGLVNQLLWSGDFTNAAWVKSSCAVASGVVTTSSAGDGLAQAVTTYTPNGTHSIVWRVSAGTATWLRFVVYQTAASSNRVSGWLNIATGVVGSATNGGTGSGSMIAVEPVGGGTYDVILTGAVGNSATAVTCQISTANADGSTTGVSGVTYGAVGAAIFQGTVTAQQILAAGGIPLTATAPASSERGRWHWIFDGTDTLGLTLPAGFNAATTIDAMSTGHVTLQNQNIVGAYSIGPSITSFGRIILPSSPSASDLALLQRYANWLAGL